MGGPRQILEGEVRIKKLNMFLVGHKNSNWAYIENGVFLFYKQLGFHECNNKYSFTFQNVIQNKSYNVLD